MNVESSFSGRHAVLMTESRRKWLIWGAVILLALIIAGFIGYRMMARSGAAPGKVANNENGRQLPTVTVLAPGLSQVEQQVAATGTIAARREMPVGIAGSGGMVSAVLVEPGQWVKAGQVLATIDRAVQTQNIASLAAQVRVAQADARLTQAELHRAESLVSRGFISRADIERKTAARDAAQARVGVATAQLAQARADAARLDVRAPADGLVLTRSIEPGQVVGPSSGVLFRIAKNGEFEMLARLGEVDLARLSTGMTATVVPVGSKQGFAARVWQVAPVIDPQSRQGIARLALSYDPALRPGGFATARIVTGVSQAPLLPESAVMSDAKGSYVYVIGNDDMVQRRPVKVGDVSDQGVSIIEGLAGQERIVASAGAFLNPGEKVIPKLAGKAG